MSLAEFTGQALLGWLFADLVSGVLHWWEDRVGSVRTPLLGRHVVEPNRQHHRDPMAFTRTGVVWRSSTTWIAAALFSLIWLALFGASVTWAFATAGGLIVNEVHRWAHVPAKAPAIVVALQETGLFQSPRHHRRHHAPISDSHYCVLTDLLNPLLDRLRLWAGLEAALTAIGLEPNRGEER